MATIVLKAYYGTETNLAFPSGLDGWPSGTFMPSSVQNAGDFSEIFVQFKLKTVAGVLNSNPRYIVRVFTSSATLGSSLRANSQDLFLGIINHSGPANTTFYSQPIPISHAFGGYVPNQWGVCIENQTGLAASGSPFQQVDNNASFFGMTLKFEKRSV